MASKDGSRTERAPSRRDALRAGGFSAAVMALAAGVSADPAAATTVSTAVDAVFATPEQYGAIGDGITDDTAALNAVLAANKNVRLGATTYLIKGSVVRPSDVNITGAGGTSTGINASATVLLCAGSDAGLKILGGGGMVRGLTVEGANKAAVCIRIGGSTQAEWGAYVSLMDVTARNAAGDNWQLYASQNGSMIHCNSIGGNRGMVLDYGVGGWLFNRLEVDSPAGVGLQLLNSSNAPSLPNTFLQCIFERRLSDGPIVDIASANNQVFYHCTFSTQQTTATTSVVSVTSNGLCEFHSPFISLQAGQAGIAVKGEPTGSCPQVRITGAPAMSGFGTGSAYFVDADSKGRVTLDGWVHNSLTGTAAYKTPSSPDANVIQIQQTSRAVVRSATTDLVEKSIVRGEAGSRHWRDTQGSMFWGPGTGMTPDVVVARANAGTLAIHGALTVSADVSAPRLLNPRMSTTLTADGPFVIDAAVSDVWHVNLNGFRLTGLSIANGVDTQRLTVLIQQGAKASSISLPTSANGFLWDGGDRNRPTAATTPSRTNTFSLIRMNGYWIETSRTTAELTYDQVIHRDFTRAGTLKVSHGLLRWYNDTGRALTLIGVRMSVGVPSSGADVVIDINRNGTSVFSSSADRPRTKAGANTSLVQAPRANSAINPRDFVTVDIDQVGTTRIGSDLMVTLSFS